MQLGTPAGSGSCRGAERGVRLGLGLALLPMDVFGVRALWGVGQHPGQGGLDGTGVASGGIAMTTHSPLHNPSWGGLMGFVWLSFLVNPLRLHDWGVAVTGDAGGGPERSQRCSARGN